MSGDRGQAARFAAYSGLRNAGFDTHHAGREVGIGDRTRSRYERAWREANGLPRLPPSGTRSQMNRQFRGQW